MELQAILAFTLLAAVDAGFLGSTVGYTAAPTLTYTAGPALAYTAAAAPALAHHGGVETPSVGTVRQAPSADNETSSDVHVSKEHVLAPAAVATYGVPVHGTVFHPLVTKTAVPAIAKTDTVTIPAATALYHSAVSPAHVVTKSTKAAVVPLGYPAPLGFPATLGYPAPLGYPPFTALYSLAPGSPAHVVTKALTTYGVPSAPLIAKAAPFGVAYAPAAPQFPPITTVDGLGIPYAH